MTLAYRWLSIHDSVSLKSDGSSMADWGSWAENFIAEITIESDQRYDLRVDAIPFLYELLNATAELASVGSFHVEIGEGLRLHGVPDADEIEIKIAFEAGGRNDMLLRKKLSPASASLFLCLKAAELAQSLERINVDLETCLSRYPINACRRGIA